MQKIYLIRDDEKKDYCYKKCRKISVGNMTFSNRLFSVCHSSECPIEKFNLQFQNVEIDGKKYDLCFRAFNRDNVEKA